MSSIKFKIDSAAINAALKVITRLAAPSSGNVNIEAKDGELRMSSLNDAARADYLVATGIKGEGLFAVPVEALTAATKGRKELTCEYGKSMLKISSGNYVLNMATVDAIPMDDQEDEKGQSWKVTAEQASWLKTAVQAVSLKPTSITNNFMPVTVKLSKKSAFVACYDEHHMAFLSDKEVQGDLEVTLPQETLISVLDVVVGNFKMDVGSALLKITNKQMVVHISLPAEDASGAISVDDVLAQAKEASAADGKEITLPKNEVLAFLDNARAVATKERSEVRVASNRDSVQFVTKTSNGTVKASIDTKCKSKVEFGVDAEYFEEAVRKSGDTVQFKLVDDAFLAFKTKTTYVVVSLNQDDGEGGAGGDDSEDD